MIERVSLFKSKIEISLFLLCLFALFLLSISYEFYSYKQFTRFDSQLVECEVLKQYTKTKRTKTGKTKSYQVLKLKSDDGLTFYTIASKNLPNIKEKKITLEIWAGDISFYEYLRTFFGFSKIVEIAPDDSFKQTLAEKIKRQHQDNNISSIYKALFLAKPLERDLQLTFSNLGVSHLIAISGFHLGVLSSLLFVLLRWPYKFLQNRYFPYRSYTLDSFFLIASVLLIYTLFLDAPPSLVRAFVMLVVGFLLYDRGIKVVSMQTLLVAVILILALFPRLFFTLGFWLSASGVFYIFLFLIHFKNLSRVWQFIFLPIWIYLLMLPYSLSIFGNFTLYHPLSILWTLLFTLFYPLSILLHLLGFGNLLDFNLEYLLHLNMHSYKIELSFWYLALEIFLSILAIYKRAFAYLLLFFCLTIFIHFIYNIA